MVVPEPPPTAVVPPIVVDGIVVGIVVGDSVVVIVGALVVAGGMVVGIVVGALVGASVGASVGALVGVSVGASVGVSVGVLVGASVWDSAEPVAGASEDPVNNTAGTIAAMAIRTMAKMLNPITFDFLDIPTMINFAIELNIISNQQVFNYTGFLSYLFDKESQESRE